MNTKTASEMAVLRHAFMEDYLDQFFDEWNGKKLILEIDHVDGIPDNNQHQNLRFICPNCHSQTDTYKGKNIGNGRHYRKVRYSNGQSY